MNVQKITVLEENLIFYIPALYGKKKKKKKESLLSAFPETYKVQSKKDGNRHKIEVREKGRG